MLSCIRGDRECSDYSSLARINTHSPLFLLITHVIITHTVHAYALSHARVARAERLRFAQRRVGVARGPPRALLTDNRVSTLARMYPRTASDFQLPCCLMSLSSTPAAAASVAAPARIEWKPYRSTSFTPVSFSQWRSRPRGVSALIFVPVFVVKRCVVG